MVCKSLVLKYSILNKLSFSRFGFLFVSAHIKTTVLRSALQKMNLFFVTWRISHRRRRKSPPVNRSPECSTTDYADTSARGQRSPRYPQCEKQICLRCLNPSFMHLQQASFLLTTRDRITPRLIEIESSIFLCKGPGQNRSDITWN